MMPAMVTKVTGVQTKVPVLEQMGITIVSTRHTIAVFRMNSKNLGNCMLVTSSYVNVLKKESMLVSELCSHSSL